MLAKTWRAARNGSAPGAARQPAHGAPRAAAPWAPSRRAALAAMGAALASRAWAQAGGPRWLSAARDAAGAFALVGVGDDLAPRFAIPLPDRGHAAAARPDAPEAVCFARRPGIFALVIDCAEGREARRLAAPPGRHFYGHGCFSADGGLLFTTENAHATGAGRIGVWDARAGYARLGDMPSGGIGPHDALRLPDGRLLVANGGLRTHPDTGRAAWNRAAMRPNLSIVDPAAGAVAATIEPPAALRPLSLRHLALRADGLAAVAGQWEGTAAATPPLLGFWRPGDGALRWADPAPALARGYAGSVAFAAGGAQAAITCPRGGFALVCDTVDGATAAVVEAADVCGVATAPIPGGLLFSDGLGGLRGADGRAVHPLPVAWDNHLIAL